MAGPADAVIDNSGARAQLAAANALYTGADRIIALTAEMSGRSSGFDLDRKIVHSPQVL